LPDIARVVGGAGLAWAIALGAVVSTAGLFLSLTLTNSRLPYVLGRQGTLPAAFASVHPRFGTPWVAVLVSAAFYAACAAFTFRELIVLNMWLYSLSLLVELAAFVWLRAAEPQMHRPWRVPGGMPGAIAAAVLPSCFALAAMATAGWTNTLAGVIAALTGPVVYAASARFRATALPAGPSPSTR
jgi:amino acid transporter